MSTTTSADTSAGLAAFDRTTSIWGPITLGLGLLISLSAALYAAFGSGMGITAVELMTAVGAVLATFGVIAVIEPISYFPILGRSAMYQAFLIGNIANKLLPAAVVAQANLGERPGTRRAELIAGSAIIGAVLIHIATLILFVGVLGTWLVGTLPAPLIATARGYILPAVFGAVVLQSVMALKSRRTTIVAVVVAALIVFVVVPLVPALTYYATALAVIITIAVSWFARSKTPPSGPAATPGVASPPAHISEPTR
ncbi:hypothetical protein [Arthrobacter sp. ok909]|jgi:hypothetical protein|uniref:hypothetical protein n=1 Tax=Arthrobacter sp. ok909 TaxID=1761746 RepID=UPI00088CA1BA|nr:hypothetical protein [Arthrobacter sp. ok909]SDP49461.1 hypothetical protein SAMN04487914_11368 [Arthrobacter sp. ok909]